MTFKELQEGTEFEFDHSELKVGCLQMAHGPWIKLTARKYQRANGQEGYSHRIGSVNVTVVPGFDCGRT